MRAPPCTGRPGARTELCGTDAAHRLGRDLGRCAGAALRLRQAPGTGAAAGRAHGCERTEPRGTEARRRPGIERRTDQARR